MLGQQQGWKAQREQKPLESKSHGLKEQTWNWFECVGKHLMSDDRVSIFAQGLQYDFADMAVAEYLSRLP